MCISTGECVYAGGGGGGGRTFEFIYVQCACINGTVCACVTRTMCACVNGTAACGYAQHRLLCVDLIRDWRMSLCKLGQQACTSKRDLRGVHVQYWTSCKCIY